MDIGKCGDRLGEYRRCKIKVKLKPTNIHIFSYLKAISLVENVMKKLFVGLDKTFFTSLKIRSSISICFSL